MKSNQRLGLLGIVTILCVTIAFVIKRVPQPAAYHNFADKRQVWNVPNFANVISNLPFVLIGCWGLAQLPKSKKKQPFTYSFLFIGILLTGFGSAYYHWNPNNDTLIWDRIPMTIVFMALLSAIISEAISERIGFILLFPLLILGISSVLYWHFTELQSVGDLRLYGLVQFYPVIFIPLVLMLFPSAEARACMRQLVWVVVWYIIAKILEYLDWQVYSLSHIVSGHTLKHLAAAVSTWYLVRVFKIKHIQG